MIKVQDIIDCLNLFRELKYLFEDKVCDINSKAKGYYYKKYTKHVTAYKNGHGILISTIKLHVIKSELIDRLYCKLDLNDACKNFSFEPLNQMQLVDMEERFRKLGFWVKSQNNIVVNTVEFYWDDSDVSRTDMSYKNDKKHLRWYFEIDNSVLENGKNYDITFAFSIPDMFPLTKGAFDMDKVPYENFEFSSSCTYDTRVDEFEYIISFEKGINPTNVNCKFMNNGRHAKKIKTNFKTLAFYNVYIAKHKKLKCYNNVCYNWNIN